MYDLRFTTTSSRNLNSVFGEEGEVFTKFKFGQPCFLKEGL